MNALMLLGTASGVGKSLLTAGLCRLLARSGVRVAPFKPQNMSNNAAACPDGGEIGRAQAFQAFACGLEPRVEMNPVLLKPEGNRRSQLIVLGKSRGILDASRFREDREPLLPTVLDAFDSLRHEFDFVLVEGAGSPSEPNLRTGDIANLGFAQAADVPAWLIGDIDRGGVFASLVGSFAVLSPVDRARIRAVLINRFRGDVSLLDGTSAWLEKHCGVPALGIVPFLTDLELPEEDAPYRYAESTAGHSTLRVVCPMLPTASNLTDLDALRLEPGIEVLLIEHARDLRGADLVILPGSKAVTRDLEWLRARGFPDELQRHLRYGGRVLGICGGLQMLGERILDPHGLETGSDAQGLGWLPIETTLEREKRVTPIEGTAEWADATPYRGYEIHHGVSSEARPIRPFHARSADDQVWGTYLHGLFDEGRFRAHLLERWFGFQASENASPKERWRTDLDRLADELRDSLDLSTLQDAVGTRLC